MMRFLSKTIVNGILLVILLRYLAEADLITAAFTAVVLSVIAYLAGDQFVLRMTNHTLALIADALLAFAFLWLAARYFQWPYSYAEILMTVVILTAAEALYHKLFRAWDDGKTSLR
ncbi:YndM family protein [Paenibacillus sp. CC-CFT747]|nr:YndM family protein [Paenibacillus sp. CC-CFT747]